MSTVHGQPPGGNVVGRLLQSAWRYKGLIAAVVLAGALLGYGWAARQPTLYQGVARALLTIQGSPSPGGEPPPPPIDAEQYLRQQAQLMRSAPVLERAVKLTGNRISAETLGQRLEVDPAKDIDLLTIRVLDSTARGATQLANAVVVAYNRQLGAEGSHRLVLAERVIVSQRPISPSPGPLVAIGMLLGVLAAAVLVWWLTRRQGPPAGADVQVLGV
jgi:uncharacterized protein involved in exopolysaccharide biosynthesis